uniref:G_PROTEIN_RECEP_F1_2 domain-containing protein n=1 Tax=Caenorhabditis tropicalis TaxID=1561998 RepID=A0A1I7TRS2_9PELO
MTIYRLVVVIKPFTKLFTRYRVFLYCGVIAIINLISLLIPYFSNCSVTFMLNRLSFVSACAPNRHLITTFQNKYAIFLPLFCMVVNLGIIVHLRFVRRDTYAKIKRILCKTGSIVVISLPKPVPNALSKLRSRRDFVMMRQTISVAVFLSIYEVGGYITKAFPDAYSSLPEMVRDAYFYFRILSIAFMNFFIYYMETPNTRQMFRRYMNLNGEQNTVSVASVAIRAP